MKVSLSYSTMERNDVDNPVLNEQTENEINSNDDSNVDEVDSPHKNISPTTDKEKDGDSDKESLQCVKKCRRMIVDDDDEDDEDESNNVNEVDEVDSAHKNISPTIDKEVDGDSDKESLQCVKKCRRMIVDDDDEDDEDESNNVNDVDEVDSPHKNISPTIDKEKDGEESLQCVKKCRRMIVDDDDEDDDEDDEDKSNNENVEEVEINLEECDEKDTETGTQPASAEDVEPSSSENDRSDSDDSEDESNTSEKIGRWTQAKGAAKEVKGQRNQRASAKRCADEIRSIHSETQRMVREGQLKLPYHVPKKMSLQDFLNRKKNKIDILRPTTSVIKKLSEASSTSNDEVASASIPDNIVSDITDGHTSQDCLSTEKSERQSELDVSDDELPDLINNHKETTVNLTGDTIINDKSVSDDHDTQLADSNKSIGADFPSDTEKNVSGPVGVSSTAVTNQSDTIDNPDTHLSATQEKIHENILTISNKPNVEQCINLPEDVLKAEPRIGKLLSEGDFIDFGDTGSDNCSANRLSSGVGKLMEKLCSHNRKPSDNAPSSFMKVNIVRKNTDDSQNETLCLETLNIPRSVEKKCIPGAGLNTLKEKLRGEMKIRRLNVRQKVMETYEMENEEGFDEEDAEAELTDKSDTDGDYDDAEEDDENIGEDDALIDEEENDDDEEKNAYFENEAEEEDEGENLRLEINGSDDDADDEDNVMPDCSSTHSFTSLVQKKCVENDMSVNDVDEVDFKCVSYSKKKANSPTSPDMFTPFSNPSSRFGFRDKKDELITGSMRNPPPLSLPFDISQDAFTRGESSGADDISYSVNPVSLFLDESQSQLLDEDGFLKMRSSGKKLNGGDNLPLKLKGLLNDTQRGSDENELVGLCSGNFMVKSTATNNMSDSETDIDKLIGLCSGVFPSLKPVKEQSPSKEKIHEDVDSGDEEDDDLRLEMVSEDESVHQEKHLDDEEENIFSDEEINEEFSRTGDVVGKNKARMTKAFLENEAELSGSEAESDEDVDLDEKDDVMEAEMGDNDDVGTEDQLRDEVGRVHLKTLIDEDKRQLRLMQEMYLPDGDLHSDNAGRQRRFNWKHLDDDDMSQDMFTNNGDPDLLEEDHESEIKWRKERFEREKWLAEEGLVTADDNSEFLKLSSTILEKAKAPNAKTIITSSQGSRKTHSKFRRGSFLSRGSDTLAKITENTKPTITNPGQVTSSRKFVFQALSQQSTGDKPSHKSVKRSTSVLQPPSKKPRLETSRSTSSLFNHL